MRVVAAATLTIGVLALAAAAQGRPTKTTPLTGSIVFHGRPGGGVYALDAGGGALKQLVRGDVEEARWSPDGRRLAFLRDVSPPGWPSSSTVSSTSSTPGEASRGRWCRSASRTG